MGTCPDPSTAAKGLVPRLVLVMATGGNAKVLEDPDETGAFPESSSKNGNGVPGGGEVLEVENPITLSQKISSVHSAFSVSSSPR